VALPVHTARFDQWTGDLAAAMDEFLDQPIAAAHTSQIAMLMGRSRTGGEERWRG